MTISHFDINFTKFLPKGAVHKVVRTKLRKFTPLVRADTI